MEPGGQLELSGAPLENLFQTCSEVNTHKDELNNVCISLEINFMGMGVLPKWDLSNIEIMPKKRSEILCTRIKSKNSILKSFSNMTDKRFYYIVFFVIDT